MREAENNVVSTKDRLPWYGIKGRDIFSMNLPYVSYNNLYLVPTHHLLLYGIVKSFWDTALNSDMLDSKDKKIMKARAFGIKNTDDFNARYSDIVDNYKNWKMYD